MDIIELITEESDILRGDTFSKYDEALELLEECLMFMNMIPNDKFGDHYSLCKKVSNFIENK